MRPAEHNKLIIVRGKAIFSSLADEKPSLYNTSAWSDKDLDWSMNNERFKIQLLRFVLADL